MSNHHELFNVRRTWIDHNPDEPECTYCGQARSEMDPDFLLDSPNGHLFCHSRCMIAHLEAQVKLNPVHRPAPPRPTRVPITTRPTPPPAKHVVRDVAGIAANVVGFAIWLAVISAIAMVIFAIFGIDSMR